MKTRKLCARCGTESGLSRSGRCGSHTRGVWVESETQPAVECALGDGAQPWQCGCVDCVREMDRQRRAGKAWAKSGDVYLSWVYGSAASEVWVVPDMAPPRYEVPPLLEGLESIRRGHPGNPEVK